jgi:hypothetical protein
MGTPGPVSLSTFSIRQQFWQRLGMTRADIEATPARELEEYSVIIQLIVRQEQEQQRRANSGR